MAFLPLTTLIAVRHFGRSVLRISSCWQVVLAAVMLVSPCAGFFEGQEVELTESSTPVEERGENSEFLETAESIPIRRTLGRATDAFGWKWISSDSIRLRASNQRPKRFVAGHRLANGLRAPLRC